MKRLFVVVVLLSQFAAFGAASADFKKGMEAARKGDFPTALQEWTPLAEQGDAAAQYFLGVMHLNGQGVAQDNEAAARLFRLSAEQGNANAQYNMGVMNVKGLGVPQSDKEALKWFRLAADQGDAASQTNLAAMYENAQGVTKDLIASHMWWSIAAAKGNKMAITERGKLEREMSAEDIAKAKKLAREWREKHAG